MKGKRTRLERLREVAAIREDISLIDAAELAETARLCGQLSGEANAELYRRNNERQAAERQRYELRRKALKREAEERAKAELLAEREAEQKRERARADRDDADALLAEQRIRDAGLIPIQAFSRAR